MKCNISLLPYKLITSIEVLRVLVSLSHQCYTECLLQGVFIKKYSSASNQLDGIELANGNVVATLCDFTYSSMQWAIGIEREFIHNSNSELYNAARSRDAIYQKSTAM